MYSTQDKTINELLEERRKELVRLMEGALRYLGVESHDVSVSLRKRVDVFDPEVAVFLIKSDTEPKLTQDDVSFIAGSLENMGYEVKKIEQRDKRLLIFV